MRDWIRQRLAEPHDTTTLNGDFAVAGLPRPQQTLTAAAVLIALVDYQDEVMVLLTRRTEHLPHHAGQISFPGGRSEADDADAIATALREAQEEIDLPPEAVDIVGHLQRYQTVTGFLVTPVVGFVNPPLALQPDPNEVAEILEVPLSFVLDSRNHERGSRQVGQQQRSYYVIRYNDSVIWGATAAMLVNFSQRLNPLKPRL